MDNEIGATYGYKQTLRGSSDISILTHRGEDPNTSRESDPSKWKDDLRPLHSASSPIVGESRSHCPPTGVDRCDREAQSLFLRSILLCMLAATLSAQYPARQAVVLQAHTEHRGTTQQSTPEHDHVSSHLESPVLISIAQTLFTGSIILSGTAVVMATLVSAKINTGGESPNEHRRVSLVHYGRMSSRLAAILNLFAFLLSIGVEPVQRDMLTVAQLVARLAASFILTV
ncbi:unnamed protein product [Peniophora sp. CBMAI 1063]|nr:unnamed protein product [Peniophora sp. CBMAI 1063]